MLQGSDEQFAGGRLPEPRRGGLGLKHNQLMDHRLRLTREDQPEAFFFVVPAQETSLPKGWNTINFGPSGTPDWNTVITDVDRVTFFYGNPEFVFIFQMWDLGMDNPRITMVPEPATLTALAAGMLLLAGRRRRRKS